MIARIDCSLADSLAFLVALILAVPTANGQTTSPSSSTPEADIGAPAPDFTLKDANGDTYTLSDYEGQYVVLEWMDFHCPYVGKHYGSGNMQQLQKTYTDKNVVWLSMYSVAPDHRKYVSPEKMAAKNRELEGQQTAMLMDPTGKVGKTYGATNTPHMFVINPQGNLIYRGGIDDKPTTDESDIEGATNYVRAALEASMNGEEIDVQKGAPYGCPIWYGK